MERRQSTRIPFKALAFVFRNGKSVSSEIQNISKRGLFVKTCCIQNQADQAFVSIYLQSGKRGVSVTLPCAVARVSDSGIGCTTPDLEPETLLFMSNLLHSQPVAPVEFMQSFYSYLDGVDSLIA